MTLRERSREGHSVAHCGARVLESVDRVLAERPDSVQGVTLAMTDCLVAYRDALIEEGRRSPTHQPSRLVQVNALLSLVFGVQYPLQGIHWEKLNQARDRFAELIRD